MTNAEKAIEAEIIRLGDHADALAQKIEDLELTIIALRADRERTTMKLGDLNRTRRMMEAKKIQS